MNPTAAPATAAARTQQKRRRWLWRGLGLLLLGVCLGIGWYHTTKPLPPGTRVASPWIPIADTDLRLLIDTTTADAYGQPLVQQQIFDEMLRTIAAARQFIVVDMFLFNGRRDVLRDKPPSSGPADSDQFRPLAAQLREALLAARRANPALKILVITDPVNDGYGASPSADLNLLRRAGIDVVVTNLDRLRDSNPAYSAIWRLTMQWWSDAALPRLLNFKANHRKVLLADDGAGGLTGIVGSMNPHDASALHSNMALATRGPALRPLLDSEFEIARFSGWQGRWTVPADTPKPIANSNTQVQVLTEGAIRDALLERLRISGRGDEVLIAMFYLSERDTVRALQDAAARGATIRLLLDPNKDAFGREKNGIPARPLAAELTAASQGAIQVRWYRTKGEQFHTKAVAVRSAERVWLMLGSANLTRRNIADFNLEANVAVEMPDEAPLATEFTRWFDTLWLNRGPVGVEYTADLGAYVDTTQSSYWAYRLMEATGLSTF